MRQAKTIKKYLDQAEVIILVLGRDGKVRLINRRGCEILGYEESDVVGKDWFDHFLPENTRDSVRNAFERVLAEEDPSVEFFENAVLTGSGGRKLIAWRNALIKDENRKTVEVLSTGEDVTVRRQTENALVESEATLRAILETCVDGIITIDEKSRILSFNPAAERIFGYAPEEVIGRDVSVLMPNPHKNRHGDYVQHFLRTSETKIIGIGREVVGRRKDGSSFPLYLAVSDVNIRGKKMFTGILRDLTDFKKLQDEMIQSQKLAAIGEMAASVGHEIKNPLAGISGAIEILMDTLDEEDTRRQVMTDILSEVQRLDNTVRDLLAFSRPWNPDTQPCDLYEVVERAAQSFQEQEELSKVRFIFGDPIEQTVEVDLWLFEKVLWNLLDNAVDSMEREGEIEFDFSENSDRVRLSIIDSGSGIPEEHQKSVFRPFFTTKNRGTGLGLAICKKILDAHGGSISISSGPVRGTRVTIELPVYRGSLRDQSETRHTH